MHIGLHLYLFGCEHRDKSQNFHQAMVSTLAGMAATFYKNGPFPTAVEENPFSRFEADGSLILAVHFMHPLLATSSDNIEVQRGFFSSYVNPGLDNSFCIRCNGFRSDKIPDFESNVQKLAETRVAFMKALIVELKPEFGYVDESFGAGVTEKQLGNVQLRRLFWTTYFGPPYVEKYRREFLLNAPAWRTEEFEQGVLLTVAETFIEFTASKCEETFVYLREKFPGIRPNRYVIPDSF